MSPDGRRVAFLRSKGGTDPVTCLWVIDLDDDGDLAAGGSERLVADPAAIGADSRRASRGTGSQGAVERAAGGVVGFATDAGFTLAAFALAGQVYTVALSPGGDVPRPAGARSPAIDPGPTLAAARWPTSATGRCGSPTCGPAGT